MKTADFYFELPKELIAQQPLSQRTASRLLHVSGHQIHDRLFTDLPELLQHNDLLVFNNSKVIPARLFGVKDTGGKVEVLIERITAERYALAHIRASKSPKQGAELLLEGHVTAVVLGRQGDLFMLEFKSDVLPSLEQYGHMPLPPYITRPDNENDIQRYQTVYAEQPGAVAAPTAGLHFDQELLNQIHKKGIETAYVTLHVGAGTFQPVRSERLEDHVMHHEYIHVSEEVVNKIRQTKANNGRVIAVGTTAVRSLESAAQSGQLTAFSGDSDIFIYPGYQFKVIDALITNFHLPESTLLMLVCAFGGYEEIMTAYQHAVEQRYRFFSYGDAMFIEKNIQ